MAAKRIRFEVGDPRRCAFCGEVPAVVFTSNTHGGVICEPCSTRIASAFKAKRHLTRSFEAMSADQKHRVRITGRVPTVRKAVAP